MEFDKALKEGYETGPAVSVKMLARKAKEIPKAEINNWARKNIRELIANMGSGSGRTAHQRSGDIGIMFSAFSIYTDPEMTDSQKKEAEEIYDRVLRRIRKANR